MLELRPIIEELAEENLNLHISQEKWIEIRTLKEVLFEPYKRNISTR